MASAQVDQDVSKKMPENETAFPNWRSDDYEIVSKSRLFIDKTLLIKEVLNRRSHHLLITAPQGFGKSTNLDMIRRFVEINIAKKSGKIGLERDSLNYRLFNKGRFISSDKEFIENNFAKFAVIYISFKDIYDNSMESLMVKYAEILSKIFDGHKYLLKSDKITTEDKETISKYIDPNFYKKLPKNDLETGIAFLARMLSLHCPNNKIFAFIDDYDSPLLKLMTDCQSSNESENECLTFFRNIFANILPPRGDIHRVLITGISTLGATLFSPDSSVAVYEFLADHPFAIYYGITPEEIDLMLKKFNMELSTKRLLMVVYGYVTLGTKMLIGTYSFLQFLVSKKFDYRPMVLTNVNLSASLISDAIRYILDKSLNESWLSYTFQPYAVDSINEIRRMGIHDYGKGENLPIKYNSYIALLKELGYFKIRSGTSGNAILIKAANEHVREVIGNSIRVFYEEELFHHINSAAEQLDSLCISPDETYFLELAKRLQKVYSAFYRTAENRTNFNIYSPFLAILGKSLFELIPDHFTSDSAAIIANGLHAVFDIDGINIAIKYKSSAKEALHEAIHSTMETRRTEYLFLGINFNETFVPSFGLITNNKNISKALYYNC